MFTDALSAFCYGINGDALRTWDRRPRRGGTMLMTLRKTPPKDSEHGALTRSPHHNPIPKALADSFNQCCATRHPLWVSCDTPCPLHQTKCSKNTLAVVWPRRHPLYGASSLVSCSVLRFRAVHRNAHRHLGRKCCDDPRPMTGERGLSATKATPPRMPHFSSIYGQARANAAKAEAETVEATVEPTTQGQLRSINSDRYGSVSCDRATRA